MDICNLKFDGKKHPWVNLKIKGRYLKPPLKLVVGTIFRMYFTWRFGAVSFNKS